LEQKEFEVRHPDFLSVGLTTVHYFPAPGQGDDVADREVTIAIGLISRIEFL
jgi:hypothetical protein